jgi:dipeptidase D
MTSEQFFEPKAVNDHFVEISKRPHASEKEDAVREYVFNCVNQFIADGLDIEIVQYDYTATEPGERVIIVKRMPAPGMEDRQGVVLQAHLDMVCVPDEDIFPLELYLEGEWLKAGKSRKTSLGADNGIGVAMILALLGDQSLNMGTIECLFTVEEELEMKGAQDFNKDLINGRKYINIDSMEHDKIIYGSAGAVVTTLEMGLSKTDDEVDKMLYYEISINGLKGGHSGDDIDKNRGNAIQLLARALFNLNKRTNNPTNGDVFELFLTDFEGGDKPNQIPFEAEARVLVKNSEDFTKAFEDFSKELKAEYEHTEPEMNIVIQPVGSLPGEYLDASSTDRLLNLLLSLPHGVLRMSSVEEDMVQTSTNLASVTQTNNSITVICAHRSSLDSEMKWVFNIHQAMANSLGISIIEQQLISPVWEPYAESRLLEIAETVFAQNIGDTVTTTVTHGGLECAWIYEEYGKEMEIISIGPKISGAHSQDEKLRTDTVIPIWDCLKDIITRVQEAPNNG